MADIGQLLLQNELFVVLGATVFAALPAVSPYWLPVKYPNSAPKQFQFSSGAAIATTVTPTATISPKPTTLTDRIYQTIVQTQTATRTTTIIGTVPRIIYDTVTEQVTSVSTYYDRHYLTKWTHFSVDPATPCMTVVYSPGITMQSPSTPASEAYPLNVAQLPRTTPGTTSWVPWKFLLAVWLLTNLFMWVWYLRTVDPTGEVQKSQAEYEIMKGSRQDVKDKYEAHRVDLVKRCEEAEKVAVMVRAKDVMLQKLGVSIPSDEADNKELDRETLANMVQARMNALFEEKQRLDHLETENKAQTAKIEDLKTTIATRLNTAYVPGASRAFDELLRSKQQEINNQRNMLHNGNASEHIKENDRLHQKKDSELSKLRPLLEEVETLRHALTEAKKETALVEEQKRTKGIADERRWNDKRVDLRKEQSDKISALKEKHDNKVAALESGLEQNAELVNAQKAKIANLEAGLRKTKRSLTSSDKTSHQQSRNSRDVDEPIKRVAELEVQLKKAQQSQSSARPDIEAPRPRFNDLNSEQDMSTENDEYLRRSLDKADQENRELQQNFMTLAKQYRETVEEMGRLKDQNANDKKYCEKEKDILRQRITELEEASR
jgi:hypothetical protein